MPVFGSRSQTLLMQVHPDLVRVCEAAIQQIDFAITTGCRGCAAQEAAQKAGNSRAHFGSSPHNFNPALAVDVIPSPFDGNWNAPDLIPRLEAISKVFIACGKMIGPDFQIVWGGCGTDGWEHIHDYPHMQLKNWKERAAHLPLAD